MKTNKKYLSGTYSRIILLQIVIFISALFIAGCYTDKKVSGTGIEMVVVFKLEVPVEKANSILFEKDFGGLFRKLYGIEVAMRSFDWTVELLLRWQCLYMRWRTYALWDRRLFFPPWKRMWKYIRGFDEFADMQSDLYSINYGKSAFLLWMCLSTILWRMPSS